MSDQTNPPTPSDPTPTDPSTLAPIETVAQRLLPNQRDALTALITGQTVKAAAQAAGVHRSTLHRWMTRDALFRAAFNAYQHEAKESARVKLLASVQDAVSTVVDGIKDGDSKLAYKLLKDLGLLSKIQLGLTDPDLLLTQIEIERAQRQASLHAESQKLGIDVGNPSAKTIP